VAARADRLPVTRPRPLDPLGLGLATLTCVVWGSNGVGARIGAASVPPWTLAALRAWLGFAILALILLWRRPRLPRSRTAWERAALIGLLQTTAPVGLLFWAVQRVDAGLAMVMMSTQPLFVAALLQRWSGGERLSRARLATLGAGFAGVALVAYAKTSGELRFEWPGLVALLLGSLSWAGGTLLLRRPGPEWRDVTSLVTVQLGFGAVVLTVLASFEHPRLEAFTLPAIASVVYLAVFTTAFTFLLWAWLVQRHGASRISPFVFLMPVAGVALGALLLGERIPPLLYPGLALVASSLVLVNRV